MLKICLNCNKLVNMHKSKQKYCSRKCTFEAYKNYKPWNTGLTKETDDRVKKLENVI